MFTDFTVEEVGDFEDIEGSEFSEPLIDSLGYARVGAIRTYFTLYGCSTDINTPFKYAIMDSNSEAYLLGIKTWLEGLIESDRIVNKLKELGLSFHIPKD